MLLCLPFAPKQQEVILASFQASEQFLAVLPSLLMEISTPFVTLKLSVVCLKAISQANSGREHLGTRWASIVDIAVLALSRLTQSVLPLCFHSEPCFISLAALVDEAGPSDFCPNGCQVVVSVSRGRLWMHLCHVSSVLHGSVFQPRVPQKEPPGHTFVRCTYEMICSLVCALVSHVWSDGRLALERTSMPGT